MLGTKPLGNGNKGGINMPPFFKEKHSANIADIHQLARHSTSLFCYIMSKRSSVITLVQALTKSLTNLSLASSAA
jgi:hypothetical protein